MKNKSALQRFFKDSKNLVPCSILHTNINFEGAPSPICPGAPLKKKKMTVSPFKHYAYCRHLSTEGGTRVSFWEMHNIITFMNISTVPTARTFNIWDSKNWFYFIQRDRAPQETVFEEMNVISKFKLRRRSIIQGSLFISTSTC